MDPTTDITQAATTPVAGASGSAPAGAPPAPSQPRRDAGHPLIWAALLVWLSVEAIGDGLQALQTVLTTATAGRSKTPTATPS